MGGGQWPGSMAATRARDCCYIRGCHYCVEGVRVVELKEKAEL